MGLLDFSEYGAEEGVIKDMLLTFFFFDKMLLTFLISYKE